MACWKDFTCFGNTLISIDHRHKLLILWYAVQYKQMNVCSQAFGNKTLHKEAAKYWRKDSRTYQHCWIGSCPIQIHRFTEVGTMPHHLYLCLPLISTILLYVSDHILPSVKSVLQSSRVYIHIWPQILHIYIF